MGIEFKLMGWDDGWVGWWGRVGQWVPAKRPLACDNWAWDLFKTYEYYYCFPVMRALTCIDHCKGMCTFVFTVIPPTGAHMGLLGELPLEDVVQLWAACRVLHVDAEPYANSNLVFKYCIQVCMGCTARVQ